MRLLAHIATPSAQMFKELGWRSVVDRLKFTKATLIYKALDNITFKTAYLEFAVIREWHIICSEVMDIAI